MSNLDILIPDYLQSNVVDLGYFKLSVFNLPSFNLSLKYKGLHHEVACYRDLKLCDKGSFALFLILNILQHNVRFIKVCDLSRTVNLK